MDDEDITIDVCERMLNELGYNVIIARNGKESLEIYRENSKQIDLVILDMIIPDMGGAKVYERLKEINPELKVLLSSGYHLDDQAQKILDGGCNDYVQKPFDIEKLSYKIRGLLDG